MNFEKPASMQKCEKDNSLIIQASDMCSKNLKLRLEPRLSMVFKRIRLPAIPQLSEENVFENDTSGQTSRIVLP